MPCRIFSNLICVFYDEKKLRKFGAWLDGLVRHLSETLEPEADFLGGFAVEFANLGKMVRNMRHCLEHPKPTQRIDLNDYRITVSRVLEEPTITIIHNETPLNATRTNQFMRFYIEQA